MDQFKSVPDVADAFQAAARAFRARDWKQAEALCQQVLAAKPRDADALHLLGVVFKETGRFEDAIATLREAIAQKPADPFQWMNLGEAYRKAERLTEAVECHRKAIGLNENIPEAHFNLGVTYRDLGQTDGAIAALRRAISLRPDYAKAQYNLGLLLLAEGRRRGALVAFQSALRNRPNWSKAHFYIGTIQFELEEPAQALDHFREVLRLEPEWSGVDDWTGRALMALGRVEEAKAAYGRAAAGPGEKSRSPDAMSVLFRETLAEVIPPDHASIVEYESRVNAAVQAFAAEPGSLTLSELHMRAAVPSGALAYYGGNVRPIMEQYAQAIYPHIPRDPLSPRQGKPTLGIVVTDRHEGTFVRCWGGIAERLSRALFDVRLVCSRSGADYLLTKLNIPQYEYLCLPVAVDEASRLLHEQDFDWLHYWEIATDPMNYYLPFFRTAPGQSTCWGWPITSGIPEVNSYLSCEQLEPPDAATHYSEQLILLKHLPTYQVKPPASAELRLRSSFELEDRQRVYLCTQNPRKYHPEFDPVLADILRTDSQGVLLIIGDRQASITELLLNRFQRTIPDVVSRVRVMPFMKYDEYLALLAVADVVLDTLHYGGGANTVYDAVAVGTPIVTLPGEFHRTLWAAAVNRKLIPQLIASTPQEYVAKAIEVARNSDLRHSLRQQILHAGAELFEDTKVVREHDAYFSEAIAATRAG